MGYLIFVIFLTKNSFISMISSSPPIQVDLAAMLDGYDPERGAAVAGGRGYFLQGPVLFFCLNSCMF